MPISVNTNSIATTASTDLKSASDALEKSLAKLSSGKRIVSSADDAAGFAVASKLGSRLTRTHASRQNNANAISYLQVQDGAMSNIGKIVGRISELRTMANDPSKNTSDIENYSKEFIELQDQIKQISKAKFNGISLFTTNKALHEEGILHRVDDAIEYKGISYNQYSRISITHEDGDYNSGHVSLNVVNLSYIVPFLNRALTAGITQTFTNNTGTNLEIQYSGTIDNGHFYSIDKILNEGSGYSFGDIVWDGPPPPSTETWTTFRVTGVNASGGVTSLQYSSGGPYNLSGWTSGMTGNLGIVGYKAVESDVKSISIETLVDTIERIADARAENGAEQNRLLTIAEYQDIKLSNLEAAHGRLMDADMALESTRFARQNVLVQSSASMVAQANQLTKVILTLLG